MDSEGKRLFVRYFGNSSFFPSTKEQIAFERYVWEKTSKNPNGEILSVKSLSVLYKFYSDLLIFFVAAEHENEILVNCAFEAFCEVLESSHKDLLDKKAFLNDYDAAVVLLDEIVDRGVIVETDATTLKKRLDLMKKGQSTSIFDIAQEKSLAGAFAAAKTHLTKSFLNR